VPLDRSLADRQLCYLETVGRVSGEPRVVEIWFAADPGEERIFILAETGIRAHWLRNLRREPAVRVQVGEQWFSGEARETAAGPDDSRARELVAAKYHDWRPGTPLEGWVLAAVPVVIQLASE